MNKYCFRGWLYWGRGKFCLIIGTHENISQNILVVFSDASIQDSKHFCDLHRKTIHEQPSQIITVETNCFVKDDIYVKCYKTSEINFPSFTRRRKKEKCSCTRVGLWQRAKLFCSIREEKGKMKIDPSVFL